MMCIKNFWFSFLYKILFLFICGYGILLHFSFINEYNNTHMFSYFTVQSNIFCFIVIIIMLPKMVQNKRYGDYYDVNSIYTPLFAYFKGMATLAIILTFSLFHFVVAVYNYPLIDNDVLNVPERDLFVHYLVPLLFVGDWILFQPKKLYTARTPFYWFAFPVFYFLGVSIRSICCPASAFIYVNKYPYFFLDVETLSFQEYMIFIHLLLIAILIIGYCMIAIDNIMCLIGKKIKQLL